MRDSEPDRTATFEREELGGIERPALERAVAARGYEPFRGRQIFHWIYQHGVIDIEAMTDLPRELRAMLAEHFSLQTPLLAGREQSVDGTEKFLLRLGDGRHIESVFIPDTPAMTF